MRLRPRTREQAFAAIEGLKDPGQKAFLVMDAFGYDAIRITNPRGRYYRPGSEITRPEQIEVKEYQIIA